MHTVDTWFNACFKNEAQLKSSSLLLPQPFLKHKSHHPLKMPWMNTFSGSFWQTRSEHLVQYLSLKNGSFFRLSSPSSLLLNSILKLWTIMDEYSPLISGLYAVNPWFSICVLRMTNYWDYLPYHFFISSLNTAALGTAMDGYSHWFLLVYMRTRHVV